MRSVLVFALQRFIMLWTIITVLGIITLIFQEAGK